MHPDRGLDWSIIDDLHPEACLTLFHDTAHGAGAGPFLTFLPFFIGLYKRI